MTAAVARYPVSIMHQPSLSPSTSTNSLSSSSRSQAASSPPSSNPPTRSSSGTSIAKMARAELIKNQNPVSNDARRNSRIRFAPLPDPRRAVVVTEDGEEHPLAPPPGSTDATELTSISIRDIPVSSLPNSSNASSEGHETSSPSPLPKPELPPIPATPTTIPMRPSTPSNSQSKKKSWLTPWKKRPSSASSSTHSLTPTSTAHSDDPSMATINLIRQTSRESTATTSSASGGIFGLGLQRWSSTQSGKPSGVPMSRTFSAQSANLPPTKKKNQKRPASAGGLPLNRGPRGQRMLNGRVYGASKNPFANVRDTEPDFVEWGYGGMGSNKSQSGVSGSDWSKVQGKGSVFHGGGSGEVSSAAVAASTDADDGSGMGWVKKRREQREKEKKEREEKEAAEAAAVAAASASEKQDEAPKEGVGVDGSLSMRLTEEPESLPVSAEHTPTPSRRPTLSALTPQQEVDTPLAQARTSADYVSKVPSPTATPELGEHHVLKAINLPPSQHRRSSSHHSHVNASPVAAKQQHSSGSESSSESESEAEPDEDEEEEEEDDSFKHDGSMIKGAGVEKFTRHKE